MSIFLLSLPPEALALYFTGGTNYVGVPLATAEPTVAITLMGWAYSTTTASGQGVVGRTISSGGPGPYYLSIQTTGNIRFSLRTSAVTNFTTDNTPFTADRWYHLAGTWDGSTMNIYINGLFSTSTAKTGTLSTATVGTVIEIGKQGVGSNSPMQGHIADVRIYNRALTAAEIRNIYYTGSARSIRGGLLLHMPLWTLPAFDISGQQRHGTSTSGIMMGRLPPIGRYRR